MENKMEKINSKRLILTLSNINEIKELENIERECKLYFSFDPKNESNPDWSIKDCILKKDVPNNCRSENYYFFSIGYEETIIGFFDFCLNYMDKNILYISTLYILEKFRKKGFGQEIIETVVKNISEIGIKEIQIHCSLRNSLGLQFWIKQGFNQIIEVECDGNLFPENFGGIKLKKNIQ
jgi:GNAT superfamily N-acetyltransferase